MSRRDDVSGLYAISKIFDIIVSYLFYINIVCAFLSIFLSETAKEICLIAQIIMAIIYVCLSVLNDSFSWYDAESARRKASIQNAFGVDLMNLTTDGYYNNTLEPSFIKYNLNTFENLFFSKSISKKMMKKELLKSLSSICVLILACIELKNGAVLLLVAQILFSTHFLSGTVSFFTYQMRLTNLYNEYYHEFITNGIEKMSQIYALLAASVEYEAIKAHYKVRLSTNLFKKMNPELSRQWTEISNKCHIEETFK